MKTGLQVFFQGDVHKDISNAEMYKKELDLCLRAEPLGFDYLLSPEHHFTEYCNAPDPLQLLTYIAAKTERIQLVSAGVILPWNDPTRVAEKASLLDMLSDGRLILGFGRGLAAHEYDRFGIPMSEARERFEEAAALVVDALATGVIKGDGPFYPRMPAEIKPAPTRSFTNRLLSIGQSEESALSAANIGAALTFIVQKPVEAYLPTIQIYRERFKEVHGTDAPPLWLVNQIYLHEDAATATRVAEDYLTRYNITALEYYGYAGKHFETTKGYTQYAAGAAEIRESGIEASARKLVPNSLYGTPDHIVDIVAKRKELIGEHVTAFCVSYAGLPFDAVDESLNLLATQVLPRIGQM